MTTRRTDLAILSKFDHHGGVSRAMVNLANALARRGLQVDIVLAAGECPYPDRMAPEVRVVDLEAGNVYKALPALLRYFRRARPRALLATRERPIVLALWAARLAGKARPDHLALRIAITLSSYTGKRPGLRRTLRSLPIRLMYRWADTVIPVSQGVAADLTHLAPGLAGHIRVLPNPTVTEEVHRLAAEPLDHPWFVAGQPPVILGVGRFTPRKDFRTLVQAFARVRAQRPCRLVLLGDGAERDNLLALGEELGVAGDMDLPGFAENPYAYMARADAFVLSSWGGEGSPNVLKEALALGLPVVSTDCESGPRQILEEGRLGRLVPIRDPEAMAGAIEATLAAPPDPDLLREGARPYTDTIAADKYREALGLPRTDPPASQQHG